MDARAARSIGNDTGHPRVSVITPFRDARDDIRDLLAALTKQTLPRGQYEIILADDGSQLAETDEFATGDEHVRVLRAPRRNSYSARNRAIKAARAPIIAACDADCRPDADWLQAGLAAMEETDIVAGLIRFALPDDLTIWGRLDIDTFLDHERAVQNGYGVTANLFFRRELFDRIDGFDESLPNQGDYDFVKRAVASGATLKFAPDVVVWHPVRTSGRQYLRKVWAVNRRYAERESAAGRKAEGLKLRSWVPAVQTVRGRRRAGRSLSLDRRRLRESGVSLRIRDDMRALPIMYFVIPYLSGIAQLSGWLAGRKARRNAGSGHSPSDHQPSPEA